MRGKAVRLWSVLLVMGLVAGGMWAAAGARWDRVRPRRPEEGYACSPDYVSELTGLVVDRAKLDEDRVSRQFG